MQKWNRNSWAASLQVLTRCSHFSAPKQSERPKTGPIHVDLGKVKVWEGNDTGAPCFARTDDFELVKSAVLQVGVPFAKVSKKKFLCIEVQAFWTGHRIICPNCRLQEKM